MMQLILATGVYEKPENVKMAFKKVQPYTLADNLLEVYGYS